MWHVFGLILLALSASVNTFDISTKTNLVLYWGQDGGALADVCTNSSADVVVLAFLIDFFDEDGLPVINFASTCGSPTFPGTNLLECPDIGQDIQTCQDAGVTILLGLGGSVGNYGFSSASQAVSLASTLWNLFGEGTSDTRPFGDAVVDGFDLDIENDEPKYYSTFITAMRRYYATGSKQYYLSGAPQCVFPDASLGPALATSSFDMVFIQFYNNPSCEADSSGFNFAAWQNWAKNKSPNKHVRLFVGVAASPDAASSGYVDPDTLNSILAAPYCGGNFGGVMLWDANQAFANVDDYGVDYADNAKNCLLQLAG